CKANLRLFAGSIDLSLTLQADPQQIMNWWNKQLAGVRSHAAVADGGRANEKVGHVALLNRNVDHRDMIGDVDKAMGLQPTRADVVAKKDSRVCLGDMHEQM